MQPKMKPKEKGRKRRCTSVASKLCQVKMKEKKLKRNSMTLPQSSTRKVCLFFDSFKFYPISNMIYKNSSYPTEYVMILEHGYRILRIIWITLRTRIKPSRKLTEYYSTSIDGSVRTHSWQCNSTFRKLFNND